VGGFTPGTVLADRYRVVGLLGRGGMGEVYRADDLKLGQPVALKFLPDALAGDPVLRERFFAEVRIARQIAHPNICRVYDIAEAGPSVAGGSRPAQAFLSMEFIDGEDLDSLLRRIGHLSKEKALDIARQLMAGLAAAHERGVLHRDLKPSNVMLDGMGRVRITDFGLAVAAGEEAPGAEVAGTPAYMAPEQLAGKGATVRSDIYALGLVLYEIYTGKPAFRATSIAELREQKEHHTPTAPSELQPGIDPVVERLIMRCLESDPATRPASVAQLAAALPGGDPLAAAIAAGETPSPDLLIASGSKDGLRPAVALALLAVIVAGAAAIVVANDTIGMPQRVGLTRSRAGLLDRARDFVQRAGYSDPQADRASGFFSDADAVSYVNDRIAAGQASLADTIAVGFFYRESPRPLASPNPLNGVGPDDPPMQYPGEIEVTLDGAGRLRSFMAVPPRIEADARAPEAAWSMFFEEAGLEPSQCAPDEPQRTPPFYADARAAWRCVLSRAPDVPVRIEAASYGGRPVSFEIVGPWTPSVANRGAGLLATAGSAPDGPALAFLLLVCGSAVLIARRNLRLGRGDRRGATRLALLVLGLWAVSWIGIEHHVLDVELALLRGFVGQIVPLVVLLWIFYVAAEPFVRRRWPQILVSWTRLLAGDWRDPRVGRDVLIGCAAGVASEALFVASVMAGSGSAPALGIDDLNPYNGSLPFAGWLFAALSTSVLLSLAFLFLLLLCRLLLRRDWAAGAALVGLSAVGTPGSGIAVAGLALLGSVLDVLVLLRIGLLATVVSGMIVTLLEWTPLTADASAWYAGVGYVVLFLIGVVALYGFRTATAGRPLLAGAALDD
jgi:serine/threonine-protein kinase